MFFKSKSRALQEDITTSKSTIGIDKNKHCERCGNCCRGMVWKKRFSFEETFRIAGEKASRKEVEEKLMGFYREYIEKKGLPVEKEYQPEWDSKNRKIRVQAKVGRCRYLYFVEDDRSVCLNYKNRPKECKDYLCKKVKEKIGKE